jgi:tetratricopeptide (TPR) repeat protein
MSNRPTLAVTIALFVACLANAGCQTIGGTPPSRAALSPTELRNDQRTRDLYLSIIVQLVQYEKYHAALAHIDEFERLYGATPRSRGLRADAWLALGELGNAEKEYSAIAKGPLGGVGRHGLGSVAAGRGDWQAAVMYFEQAVHEDPTNTRFLTDLSGAYSMIGRTNDADFALKKAQELSPASNRDKSRVLSSLAEPEQPAPASSFNPELSISAAAASDRPAIVVESATQLDGAEQSQ